MGIMYDARWRAIDSSGNPLSGATLTIYTAGTTTPADIFRDAGLTTPMTNPTSGSDKADSAGRFPQIHAAEGALFDVILKNSSGSTVASYEKIEIVGAGTGAITRDFGTNGRFAIRGTGGNPHIEFGDQTGDNTGGTGRIGGWEDTQADSLELDAALTNTTGLFKENSKKLVGVVYTDVTQVTAASSVDIQLPNSPSGVREYLLEIWDYSQSGAGNCNARLSFDGGGTYPAAASSYNGMYGVLTGAGWTTSTFTNTFAQLHNIRGGTNAPARGHVLVTTPDSGNDSTLIEAQFTGLDSATYTRWESVNYGPSSSGRATHIRLLMSANAFTFKYRLIIKRASGDA